ncbi:MAG: hypothetical protein M3Z75_14015 [Actinomycetota bacterium]|nr:hypothetical protein [Actinomycetota bacterium]
MSIAQAASARPARAEPTSARPASTWLGELSAAGVPWLGIDMAAAAGPGQRSMSAGNATILDIADPHAVPVTVNPLEPAPGYPVQAHAERVAGLFEAAFGLTGPVAAAVRAGLRRIYQDCGWDMVTGTVAPGTVTPPAVPLYRQLRTTVMAVAEDLGYSPGMRADVHAFLRSRLDPLWGGPAGRFLEGGHPVDAARLLRANTLVISSDLTDDEAASFLTGVLLIRLAEQLRPARRPGHGRPGHGRPRTVGLEPVGAASVGSAGVVVIGSAAYVNGHLAAPSAPLQAALWFSRLLEDIRSCGTGVVVAGHPQQAETTRRVSRARGAEGGKEHTGDQAAMGLEVASRGVTPDERAEEPAGAAGAERHGRADRAGSSVPVLLGRRSAACGERCRRQPCDGYELHAAGLLARDEGQAWLRLWVQTLVLAFLTGHPVPRVPRPLCGTWPLLSPRRRDCLLATVVDGAVTARAAALRPSYDPRRLTSVIALVAARMLEAAGGGDQPLAAGPVLPCSATPFRAGPVWVIPQLRWLHEIERANPLGQGGVRLDDIAPPLDFGLTGLSDWPGIRVRDRLGGLRRHPLSMESRRNRERAGVALLGDDAGCGLDADLAITGLGLSPRQRLRHAAEMMGTDTRGQEPGWLEVVLSWPDRIIRAA